MQISKDTKIILDKIDESLDAGFENIFQKIDKIHHHIDGIEDSMTKIERELFKSELNNEEIEKLGKGE